MRPIILVNGGPALDRQFHTKGFTLNKTYTAAVTVAGGLPMMALDWESLDDYVAMADGLVLSGSQSFSPVPGLLDREADHRRDADDNILIQKFIAAKKPIMGVCLGIQQINVALGGTLHKNFKLEYGKEHMMSKHTVRSEPGSLLRKLYGEEFWINSRHGVKIGQLADGLRVTAWSPDHVEEAVEHASLPIWAYQWHPERMRGDFAEPPEGPDMIGLFEDFVRVCAEEKAKREADK